MTQPLEALIAQLEGVQDSRALGARLSSVLQDGAVCSFPGAHVTGAGEIEMALLPFTLCLPDLTVRVEDAIATSTGAHMRVAFQGTHQQDGILGKASGGTIRGHAMAEFALTQGKIESAYVLVDTSLLGSVSQNDAGQPPLHNSEQDPSPWEMALIALVTDALTSDDLSSATQFAPACLSVWPGAEPVFGPQDCRSQWHDLRAALPDGQLQILSFCSAQSPLLPPRASVRWVLNGQHTGWSAWGAPTQAPLTVDAMTQAEFGPDGITRIWTVFDTGHINAQIHSNGGQP